MHAPLTSNLMSALQTDYVATQLHCARPYSATARTGRSALQLGTRVHIARCANARTPEFRNGAPTTTTGRAETKEQSQCSQQPF